MEQQQERAGAMERTPDFDAKREAYEAARAELARIIDNPDKTGSLAYYRALIGKARAESAAAHKAMLAAWG